MTRFLQHCGQCKKWTATQFHEGDSPKPRQVLGMCAKYDQARHSQRELCKPEWDKEIKRLGLILKAKDSQIKIMLKEKAILDPKRTMEALGFKWPKPAKAKTTR